MKLQIFCSEMVTNLIILKIAFLLDFKYDNFMNPLLTLIANNRPDLEILDFLNSKKFKKSYLKDYYGPNTSALIMCCHRKHIFSCEKLLKLKDDPNHFNFHNIYPLLYPCKDGALEIVQLLLKYGAITTGIFEKNCEPIYQALSHKHFDIAKEIISHSKSNKDELEIHKQSIDNYYFEAVQRYSHQKLNADEYAMLIAHIEKHVLYLNLNDMSHKDFGKSQKI